MSLSPDESSLYTPKRLECTQPTPYEETGGTNDYRTKDPTSRLSDPYIPLSSSVRRAQELKSGLSTVSGVATRCNREFLDYTGGLS